MRTVSSVDWLSPFVNAAAHTLRTMLDCHCVVGEVSQVGDGSHRFDVVSSIRFAGATPGSLAFSVPEDEARAILLRMTGMESEVVDELVRDAVGEMANMIAGAGKRHLEHLSLQLDLPRVSVGSVPDSHVPRWTEHYWVPLQTEFGTGTLDVGFNSTVRLTPCG